MGLKFLMEYDCCVGSLLQIKNLYKSIQNALIKAFEALLVEVPIVAPFLEWSRCYRICGSALCTIIFSLLSVLVKPPPFWCGVHQIHLAKCLLAVIAGKQSLVELANSG